MISWFKELPEIDVDFFIWKPLITSTFLRNNYMKFVYSIAGILIFITGVIGRKTFNKEMFLTFTQYTDNLAIGVFFSVTYCIFLFVLIFILHELLHIIIYYKQGDLSITYHNLLVRINTNAIITKKRFIIGLLLPIIVLTILPLLVSNFIDGYVNSLMLYIGCNNLVIGSFDIFESLIIIFKPNNSMFCCGYYMIRKSK